MSRRSNLRSEAVVQHAMLFMGAGFLAAGLWFTEPVMDEKVYGAAIGRYPAEWWAVSIIGACLLYLWGICCHASHYWPAAAARLLGIGWHTATISAFMWGATQAVHGKHLVLFSAAMLLMMLRFLWWTLGDLLWSDERPEDGR